MSSFPSPGFFFLLFSDLNTKRNKCVIILQIIFISCFIIFKVMEGRDSGLAANGTLASSLNYTPSNSRLKLLLPPLKTVKLIPEHLRKPTKCLENLDGPQLCTLNDLVFSVCGAPRDWQTHLEKHCTSSYNSFTHTKISDEEGRGSSVQRQVGLCEGKRGRGGVIVGRENMHTRSWWLLKKPRTSARKTCLVGRQSGIWVKAVPSRVCQFCLFLQGQRGELEDRLVMFLGTSPSFLKIFDQGVCRKRQAAEDCIEIANLFFHIHRAFS
ncbi:hypothetical protein NC653_024100 [Populus alba x Populus x berolinensis]|uniref:Uncharacterized protein n=1 Tax=Populus alba x Populus x berolinensis TaxID=444605 RepID=A0AAD6MAF2_9ROSI|nr:hypothetical protein NC653_024100 [Populus alba x Populus x berolinensis]